MTFLLQDVTWYGLSFSSIVFCFLLVILISDKEEARKKESELQIVSNLERKHMAASETRLAVSIDSCALISNPQHLLFTRILQRIRESELLNQRFAVSPRSLHASN